MTTQKPEPLKSITRTPIGDVVFQIKLLYNLMADSRVNFFLKLLPVLGLIYWAVPFDLIPAIPGVSAIDDIGVMWLLQYLFIELCPVDVVNEIRSKLNNLPTDHGVGEAQADHEDEIIDGEVKEI